jgi:hypothetical protein
MVILLLPFFAGDLHSVKTFFQELFRRPLAIIAGLIVFSLAISIQLIYYHLQSGHWFVYAYAKEGFDFSNPHFFRFLFSYCNGFFVYAPVMFFSLMGLLIFLPKNTFRFFSMLIPLCIIVYVFSSWWVWNYAGAFGMRPMAEYLSLFALLLGIFLNRISIRKFIFPSIAIFILLPLTFLCQFQIWQYRWGIIGVNRMTKEKYWFVFLQNREQFYFINAEDPDPQLPKNRKLLYSKKLDFETSDSTYDNRSVISSKAFSGSHCINLREENNHSPQIKIRLGDYLPDSVCGSAQLWVNASAKWLLEDKGSESRMYVIVGNKENNKLFKRLYVIHQQREENKWGEVQMTVQLPALAPDDTLRIFPERNLWYPVYVDDLKLDIYLQKF